MHELLQAGGSECEWESVFFHDTTLYNLPYRLKQMDEIGTEGESSWMAVPWLGLQETAAIVVVHLVRHPLKVMSSLLHLWGPQPGRSAINRPYHEFLLRHVPELRGMQLREMAMARWVIWNELIERTVTKAWRLEDQKLEMCQFLGVEVDPEHPLLKLEHHNRFNPAPPPVLTWDDFPNGDWKDQAQKMARRYGYDV